MRWTLGLIAPALVAITALAPITAHAATPAVAVPSVATSGEFTSANFALVNAQRAAAGIAPLRQQAWAQGVAQAHSLDMASAGTIFHNMAGYMSLGRGAMGASYLGENVAMGTNLDYAQNALLTSPLHLKNMLDPRFNYVGIGAATDAGGQVYITEDFAQINGAGTRPATPPVVAAPPAAPAPRPVVATAAPAPRPVVAPAAMTALRPVVAPKPAATVPAAPVLAPATVAVPAVAAPAAAHASGMKVVAHTSPMKPAAMLLYALLGLVAVFLTLGIGYKLTRFLPGL